MSIVHEPTDDKFLEDIKSVCVKHGVSVIVGMYAGPEVVMSSFSLSQHYSIPESVYQTTLAKLRDLFMQMCEQSSIKFKAIK